MKVLFASLTRIGDYIQHMHIVRAWQKVHPDVEVHVLVNDLVPVDLMALNSNFSHFVFPRFKYQKQINQPTVPLLYPFWDLRALVQKLRSENYERVFDLSLQKQSSHFLKLIDPGFSYSKTESQVVSEYLNPADQEHLIDKLKKVYRVPVLPEPSLSGPTTRVLIQVTTSDLKKTVDLVKWQNLYRALVEKHPSLDFYVLSGPSERNKLKQIFEPRQLFVCSFSELSQIFDGGTKLISLDTSIKHFAAQFRVPTVEISVGSSHPIKNAAYQLDNFIFSADYHCRPCSHTEACRYGRNHCQDAVDFQKLETFLGQWILSPQPESFQMRTGLKNGNLSLVNSLTRGDKWNQRKKSVNPSL